VVVQVPADPALIGLTFCWQALVGRATRLTNVATTTFAGW
jgi:hypothetical protein